MENMASGGMSAKTYVFGRSYRLKFAVEPVGFYASMNVANAPKTVLVRRIGVESPEMWGIRLLKMVDISDLRLEINNNR